MGLIHNDVFDAALTEVATCTEAEVQTSASSVLVDGVVLNSGNFGSPAEYTSGGREIECLQSSASDMKNIAVSTGGNAYKVALKDASAAVLIEADISSAPVVLGSSDQVNLGTFKVILADPA